MQDHDQEMMTQLSRARSTMDEIEQLCFKSAQLTTKAEELLSSLRFELPMDTGPDSSRRQ